MEGYYLSIVHKVKFQLWNQAKRPMEDPDVWFQGYVNPTNKVAWRLFETLCVREVKKEYDLSTTQVKRVLWEYVRSLLHVM
jgi:hypothetical protein